MSSINSITSEKLARLIGIPKCPTLIDVRADDNFAADPRLIPGSVRRSCETASEWAAEFRGRSAVVICHNGRQLSQGVAALLRESGSSAEVLEDGFAEWVRSGLPLVPTSKLPTRNRQGRTLEEHPLEDWHIVRRIKARVGIDFRTIRCFLGLISRFPNHETALRLGRAGPSAQESR